jgi:hypothetical protein
MVLALGVDRCLCLGGAANGLATYLRADARVSRGNLRAAACDLFPVNAQPPGFGSRKKRR